MMGPVVWTAGSATTSHRARREATRSTLWLLSNHNVDPRAASPDRIDVVAAIRTVASLTSRRWPAHPVGRALAAAALAANTGG